MESTGISKAEQDQCGREDINQGEDARSLQAHYITISDYEARFDRKRFIAWLKAHRVARHVATFEECERLMAEIRKQAGGFTPGCKERMLTFFRVAEDKISVRAVTSSIRKMRTGLTRDYLLLSGRNIR